MEIREFTLPDTADDAAWAGFFDLRNRDNREQVGGPEWDQDPSAELEKWRLARHSRCRRWLATEDGVPVGCAFLWWETRDDPDLAMVHVYVVPERRRRGIGAALADKVREAVAVAGLTRAIVGINTPPHSAEPLSAPDGAGAVDGTHPGVRMALREGFALTQAEVWSRFDIHAGAAATAAKYRAAAGFAGDDYEVITWQGPAGDELLEGLALLKQRMRADLPTGELQLGESRWDAARMREHDELRTRTERLWRAVVRHRPTGELVALNELQQPRSNPRAFVGQGDTVVRPAHRGRRLGLLVKAANLAQVRPVVPEGVEVNTCNAAENAHMRAINRELGFTDYLWAGTFHLGPAT